MLGDSTLTLLICRRLVLIHALAEHHRFLLRQENGVAGLGHRQSMHGNTAGWARVFVEGPLQQALIAEIVLLTRVHFGLIA